METENAYKEISEMLSEIKSSDGEGIFLNYYQNYLIPK